MSKEAASPSLGSTRSRDASASDSLGAVELKPFVPAKNFELSTAFYSDLGFEKRWSSDDLAYMCKDECAFLLQRYNVRTFAEHFVLHLLVRDVDAWRLHIRRADLERRYGVTLGAVATRPWGMRDFTLTDPSGVLWRIAQNLDA